MRHLFGAPSRPQLTERQALQDFNRSLVLIVDPESLQASVAARMQELTGVDRVVILQLDADKQLLSPTFSLGVEPASVDRLSFHKRGRLARWLLTNEACLVVPRSPQVVASLEEGERGTLARLGVQVCVPLISLNRLIGLILLGSEHSGWSLDSDRIDLLQLLASQAGLAFENALLYREQRDRLRRLDRAERLAVAGQLAAGVAHEIRNPLTSIRSTVQYLLQDYSAGHPKRVLVEEVLSEVDRIDRTVGGLLSLTRSHEIERREVALGELLEQTLVLVSVQAHSQDVTISRPSSDAQISVRGDAGQLKQVFLNLLLNALQAMPGGGTLTVYLGRERSRLSGDAPAWALVRIADTGVGIPRQQMEKVFDPFYTTKREGTGLGLSVSYWIVQRHEGELDLTSEPGRGTTATVRLPVASLEGGSR